MTFHQYIAYLLICLPLNLFVAILGASGGVNLRQHAVLQVLTVIVAHVIILWAVAVVWLLKL